MSSAQLTPPLNDVQMMLLRLFSRPMTDEDVKNIRSMLLEYYEQMLQKEVETVIDKKDIQREDFEKMLRKDQRS